MMQKLLACAAVFSLVVDARGAAPASPATDPRAAANAAQVESLNKNLGLDNGHLKFVAGEGGLICAEIKTETCTGKIYLQGAHVAAWQPVGQEPVIFMSTKGTYAEGHPIRGGVPIAFPWFANKADDAAAPLHGVVRTVVWDLERAREEGGKMILIFSTKSNAKSKAMWPGDFEVRETVAFGRQLEIELEVKNTGNEAWTFEESLHTYFFVKDVQKAKVLGLAGVEYLDKVDAKKRKKQEADITFTAETDRVYLNTKGPYTIVDEMLNRRITIEKTGSNTGVVWNPGAAKVVSDLGEKDWVNMLCVETANAAENAVTLKAGETHVMKEVVTVGK